MVGTEVGSVPKYFLKSWSVNPSDLRLLRTLLIAATFGEPLFSTAPYSSPVLNWPTTAASLTWPALIAPSTIGVSSRTASIWPAFRAVKAAPVVLVCAPQRSFLASAMLDTVVPRFARIPWLASKYGAVNWTTLARSLAIQNGGAGSSVPTVSVPLVTRSLRPPEDCWPLALWLSLPPPQPAASSATAVTRMTRAPRNRVNLPISHLRGSCVLLRRCTIPPPPSPSAVLHEIQQFSGGLRGKLLAGDPAAAVRPRRSARTPARPAARPGRRPSPAWSTARGRRQRAACRRSVIGPPPP